MISLRKTAELLGARAEDLADLLLISPRTMYYILSGRMGVPGEFEELVRNIRQHLTNEPQAPAGPATGMPLKPRFRLSLQRRLASLRAQHTVITHRIRKTEPAVNALHAQRNRLEHLPAELAPMGQRQHFARWKKRMLDRTLVVQNRNRTQQLTNDRIRLAAIEAEITALEQVLGVS